MRRILSVLLLAAMVVLAGAARVQAQETGTDNSTPVAGNDTGENGDPNNSTPVNLEVPTTPPVVSTIPVGCDPLIVPQAIVVVTFAAMDGPTTNGKPNTDPRLATTTRFDVVSVRAGSVDGFGDGKQIDIDYKTDKQFLTLHHTYVAAVAADPITGRLVSKLKIPPADFGGNQVIGVDDKPNNCPKVLDTIITTELDGKAVDTGILSRFTQKKKDIVLAFAEPAAAIFAVLVALVLVKHFGMALWRALRRFRFGVQRSRARGKRLKAARKADAAAAARLQGSATMATQSGAGDDRLISHS